jgi:hypothetical protein
MADSGLADADKYVALCHRVEDARRAFEDSIVETRTSFVFSNGACSGVAHKSLSKAGGWRITWLAEHGKMPTGHTEYKDYASMVSDLLGGGWSFRRILHMSGRGRSATAFPVKPSR